MTIEIHRRFKEREKGIDLIYLISRPQQTLSAMIAEQWHSRAEQSSEPWDSHEVG
jgi:hypothetical protein